MTEQARRPVDAPDLDGGARVDVLGVHVSAVDLPAAVDVIGRWIESRQRHYVCITGVHGVVESLDDPELRRIHNDAGLVVPDGMPLVWAGRWAGAVGMGQVRGSDLMVEVCRRAAEQGWRTYLYGGAQDVLQPLAESLQAMAPGLQVVGSWSPPYRPLTADERVEVVERINAARPDVVWVGLSTPKQERWMAEVRADLEAPVLLGCGAAFDMNAGRLPQAPELLRRVGLEWAYRVYREPRRLWRRYARAIPAFLGGVARRRPRLLPSA